MIVPLNGGMLQACSIYPCTESSCVPRNKDLLYHHIALLDETITSMSGAIDNTGRDFERPKLFITTPCILPETESEAFFANAIGMGLESPSARVGDVLSECLIRGTPDALSGTLQQMVAKLGTNASLEEGFSLRTVGARERRGTEGEAEHAAGTNDSGRR